MVTRRADVARLAGTSPAVVSYVLNGGPRKVAPQTRARVLAAIEQLGYRPNGIARSLRMNRTMSLGLVIPDNANPFFAELARAVEDAAFAHGYTLLIGNASEDEARQATYVRTFLERQVDGLFLVPAHGPLTCLPELQRARTPWVVLDRHVPGLVDVPEVRVDNRAGAREATAHLLWHGRQRIACIAGPADVMSATDRVAGWRDALTAANLGPATLPAAGGSGRREALWHVPFGQRAGYQAARQLLAEADLDAVFVASDEQALGVMRAITELSRRCPDDVALVSFDGIPAAAYATPGLSTMAQPFAEIGLAGMARLVERIQPAGESAGPAVSVLPVRLRARGSCGCQDPPGGDLPATDDPDEQGELSR